MPLVQQVLTCITPQLDDVIISANRNQQAYSELGLTVIEDSFAAGEYAGPLAGILSALYCCETEFLLSVPCDTPCLPVTLQEQLYSEMLTSGADVVTVDDGNRQQSIIMLVRTHMANDLKAWLEQGNRAVQDWIAATSHSVVSINEPAAFNNLNTESDIQAFAQTLCK